MASKRLSFGLNDGSISRIVITAPPKAVASNAQTAYHIEAFTGEVHDETLRFVGMAAVPWTGQTLVIYLLNGIVYTNDVTDAVPARP